jgi:hypothetical protein
MIRRSSAIATAAKGYESPHDAFARRQGFFLWGTNLRGKESVVFFLWKRESVIWSGQEPLRSSDCAAPEGPKA